MSIVYVRFVVGDGCTISTRKCLWMEQGKTASGGSGGGGEEEYSNKRKDSDGKVAPAGSSNTARAERPCSLQVLITSPLKIYRSFSVFNQSREFLYFTKFTNPFSKFNSRTSPQT